MIGANNLLYLVTIAQFVREQSLFAISIVIVQLKPLHLFVESSRGIEIESLPRPILVPSTQFRIELFRKTSSFEIVTHGVRSPLGAKILQFLSQSIQIPLSRTGKIVGSVEPFKKKLEELGELSLVFGALLNLHPQRLHIIGGSRLPFKRYYLLAQRDNVAIDQFSSSPDGIEFPIKILPPSLEYAGPKRNELSHKPLELSHANPRISTKRPVKPV